MRHIGWVLAGLGGVVLAELSKSVIGADAARVVRGVLVAALVLAGLVWVAYRFIAREAQGDSKQDGDSSTVTERGFPPLGAKFGGYTALLRSLAVLGVTILALYLWANQSGRYQVAPLALSGNYFVVLDTATGRHWVHERRSGKGWEIVDEVEAIPLVRRVLP